MGCLGLVLLLFHLGPLLVSNGLLLLLGCICLLCILLFCFSLLLKMLLTCLLRVLILGLLHFVLSRGNCFACRLILIFVPLEDFSFLLLAGLAGRTSCRYLCCRGYPHWKSTLGDFIRVAMRFLELFIHSHIFVSRCEDRN